MKLFGQSIVIGGSYRPIDVEYNCVGVGEATVTLTLPFPGDNFRPAVFTWKKRCGSSQTNTHSWLVRSNSSQSRGVSEAGGSERLLWWLYRGHGQQRGDCAHAGRRRGGGGRGGSPGMGKHGRLENTTLLALSARKNDSVALSALGCVLTPMSCCAARRRALASSSGTSPTPVPPPAARLA
eukprot:COSAG04_NODE_14060_length_582_cov_0.931677_1_plen_180_part_01